MNETIPEVNRDGKIYLFFKTYLTHLDTTAERLIAIFYSMEDVLKFLEAKGWFEKNVPKIHDWYSIICDGQEAELKWKLK